MPVLLQALEYELCHFPGQMRIELLGIPSKFILMLHDDGQRSFALKRNLSGDHLVEDYSQGVDICPLVDSL